MKKLLEQARRNGKKRPLLGGHRGCLCQHAENTIPALEEGARRGADYFEIDLQLTKDNQIVVYHDMDLAERTPLSGYVHEYTLAQLRDVCAINTLEEILGWGHDTDSYFALELKSLTYDTQRYAFALVEQLPALVNKMCMRDNVYAFGIDYQVISRLRHSDPLFTTGLIVPHTPADPVRLVKDMGALVYLSYIQNMTPEIVGNLQKAGYYVSGAILREERWVREAVKSGVDMFETDFPEKYIHR